MKRHTGQKALYEAISKGVAKSQRRSILERLRPADAKVDEPAAESVKPAEPPRPVVEKPAADKPTVEKPAVTVFKPVHPADPSKPPAPGQAWLRPKAVQVHDGRIEVSVPYTIGVTVVLVAILIMLGAFRLGQMNSGLGLAEPPTGSAGKLEQPGPRPSEGDAGQVSGEPDGASPGKEADAVTATAPVQGDHVIVLAQYPKRDDLLAAKEYFDQKGVPTDVIEIAVLREYLTRQRMNVNVLGNAEGFILVTSTYYTNPKSQGSDGYKALQKIIELGRGYKAPAGREPFAPKYFSDAYPMKIR